MSKPSWTLALAKMGLDNPFGPQRTVPHMRTALRRAAPLLDVKAPPLAAVGGLEIPVGDIARPARLYVPESAGETGPCTLFLHGGGYLIGDLETHDLLCRRLAAKSGVRVLALDYRLAPEHPFPAAVDDMLAAFDWLAGEGARTVGADPARLAVAGDSAGGGLAAVLGQQCRDRLAFQLLIYPLLQLAETRKPKLKALEGHLLSVTALNQIAGAYITADGDPADLRISPLLEDDLAGVPPAYIAAAELDPLFDEGQAYRDRLTAVGTPVEYVLGKALPHGYFNMTAILPGAKTLVDRAAIALGTALNTPANTPS